jgi:GT2 family glycosyltransferase
VSVGVVIPVGPGRIENLCEVLRSIDEQYVPPEIVVMVFDGPEAYPEVLPFVPHHMETHQFVVVVTAEKHEPGMEQPRNVGVRHLPTDITDVWFLDSDVIVGPEALAELGRTMKKVGPGVVVVSPYDWLPPGIRTPEYGLHNDPRWVSFDTYPDDYTSTGKLNDGLACFSGNLVWSVDEFERVGGFWNELFTARCEDGELGLRAVAEGVPIAFCKRARGWHLHHPINFPEAERRNSVDVPRLNARHPWVEAGGLVVVDKDGKRFDQRCPRCQRLINTGEFWTHEAGCTG